MGTKKINWHLEELINIRFWALILVSYIPYIFIGKHFAFNEVQFFIGILVLAIVCSYVWAKIKVVQ